MTDKPIILCSAGRCCPKLYLGANSESLNSIVDDYGNREDMSLGDLKAMSSTATQRSSQDPAGEFVWGSLRMRNDQAALIAKHI